MSPPDVLAQKDEAKMSDAKRRQVWKWCAGAVKEEFPRYKVSGPVKGFSFKLTRAIYFKDQGYLLLEDQHPAPLGPGMIGLRLWTLGKVPANQTFTVANGQKPNGPQVEINFIYNGKIVKSQKITPQEGYGLRLRRAAPTGNKLPGYIIMKLPYARQSYIAGYFVARIK